MDFTVRLRFSDRLNRDSVPDASTNRSSLRVSDHNAQQLEWENRQAILLEHVRNQDLVSKLTEEIKKTVNESMEGVINGLRSEVYRAAVRVSLNKERWRDVRILKCETRETPEGSFSKCTLLRA